jgi:hypothetical protein
MSSANRIKRPGGFNMSPAIRTKAIVASLFLPATLLQPGVAGAFTCPAGPAEVVITSPSVAISTTRDSTVDIEGAVFNACALYDITYKVTPQAGEVGETFEGHAHSVKTNFSSSEDRWDFEILGVELNQATDDNGVVNNIEIVAEGHNSGQATVSVVHEIADTTIPPGGTLNPTDAYYTKAKVTWSHVDDQEAFSTNARLGVLAQPFLMPCAPDDTLIVRLYPENNADPQAPLYMQSFHGSEFGTCNVSRFRKTGPRGEIRDVSMDMRSDGSISFYVYGERLDFGPSDVAFVESLGGYTVVIDVIYADPALDALEWQVEIGPKLSFENFYMGDGTDARTVVRYNR